MLEACYQQYARKCHKSLDYERAGGVHGIAEYEICYRAAERCDSDSIDITKREYNNMYNRVAEVDIAVSAGKGNGEHCHNGDQRREYTGKVAYTNVILTEKELGYNIHEIPNLLPNSDEISFNVDLKIDEPRELVFFLTALDPSGNTHLCEAYINASTMDIGSSVPNATPAPGDDNGASIVDINVDRQIDDKGQQLLKLWNTLKIVFIIALVIVVLLGAFEVYLFIRSRRAAKR